jgi:hypothetical protein
MPDQVPARHPGGMEGKRFSNLEMRRKADLPSTNKIAVIRFSA